MGETTKQFSFDFEPGLADEHDNLMEVVQAVYHRQKLKKAVASKMDLSPSELARRIKDMPEDLVFRATHLEDFIAATGDLAPIHYLIDRFMQDRDAKQIQNQSEIARLLGELKDAMGGEGL